MNGNDNLDDETKALLGTILGPEPEPQPIDDPIVVPAAEDDPPTSGLGAAPAGSAPDTSSYVPRADFDRLVQQMTELQKKVGSEAARVVQSAPAPSAYQAPSQYAPPGNAGGPIDPHQAEADFNARFYANPAQALIPLIQNAMQQQSQPLYQNQIHTQAAVAHQSIHQMRSEFERADPELARAVLANVDREVAATSPDQLAQLVSQGRLHDVYQDVLHREIGKRMRDVYKAAASKRQGAAPPPMSGGSLAGASDLASRRRSGPIRQSEISEVDRVAIEEAKRFGISAEKILGIETA